MTTLNTQIRSVPKIYRNKRIYQGRAAATTILASGQVPAGGTYIAGDGIDISASIVSLDKNFIEVAAGAGVKLKHNNITQLQIIPTGVEIENNLYFNTHVTTAHVDKFIYWGDATDGWDTYIVEYSDDCLRIVCGGETRVQMDNNSFILQNKGLSVQNVAYPFSARVDGVSINMGNSVYSNTAGHGTIWAFNRFGGTYSAKAVTPANSVIANLRFYVYDGSSALEAARYQVYVDGTPSAGSVSAYHRWWTRETTGALTEYMQLSAAGILKIDNINEFNATAGVTIGGVLKTTTGGIEVTGQTKLVATSSLPLYLPYTGIAGTTYTALWSQDAESHIKHVEDTTDAAAGHGELIFETNAATGQAINLGGFRFRDGGGTTIMWLDNYNRHIGVGSSNNPSWLNLNGPTGGSSLVDGLRIFRATYSTQWMNLALSGSTSVITTTATSTYGPFRIDQHDNTTPRTAINIPATGAVELNFAGTKKLESVTGGVEIIGGAEHPDFTSGFQGTNWQITGDGDAEFRDVLISGGLSVYELILNRLHYQCGGLIIGAGGGKIKTVHVSTPGSEQLEFEDPEGNSILPFTVGAIVMLQDFDLNRTTVIKKIVRQVASISSQILTLTTTTGWLVGDDTGAFAFGDEVVAIGHVSNAALDASIYMSAVDSDNPFLRVFDGVSTYAKWSLGDKTTIKLQLGNLASLASYGIVPADPGYGLYSDNVYLTGKIVATSGNIGGWAIESDYIHKNITADRFLRINASNAGYPEGFQLYRNDGDIGKDDVKIVQMGQLYNQGNSIVVGTDYGFQIKKRNHDEDGYEDVVYMGGDAIKIAGWNIDYNAIYTGTKHVAAGYTTGGMTLGSDGSFHSKNFHVNDDGGVGVRGTLIKAYTGVSDNIILSHDATVCTNSLVEDLLKTITLGVYVESGKTLRIKFDLRTTNTNYTARGQIYRNGDVVGTLRSTLSLTYVTFSEDIAGWNASDEIRLYVWINNATANACVADFRVCGVIVDIVDEVTGSNS